MSTQEKTMTTMDIANRLVELCRKGQFDQALQELFAENAVSIEPDSAAEQGWQVRTEGLSNMLKKGEQWNEMVEEYHSLSVSDPLITVNGITFTTTMDVTMKGNNRMKVDEICVYQVKDGKIISEQFFY